MERADWYYDDRRQVGIDFADDAEVASYDARQGSSAAADAALLRELSLGREHVMADLGCGTGLLACTAAGICPAVHAVDISPAMLRAAQRRAAGLGLSNIAFHHAGFLSVDLGSATLDLVTSKFAFHHLPDFWKGVALVRLFGALKPGGRLYLSDVAFACAPHQVAEAVEGWAAWMAANTGYARAEVAGHVRDEHSTYGWILEGLIERAGFRLLQARYDGVYATYLAEKPA